MAESFIINMLCHLPSISTRILESCKLFKDFQNCSRQPFVVTALAHIDLLTRRSTFVGYSGQEGSGIGCDFGQFGIPDLRIRCRAGRGLVHLTDLHIMPHKDPWHGPPWLVCEGSEPNSGGLNVAPNNPTISTCFRPPPPDEGISGCWLMGRRGQFSGNTLP